MPTAPVPAPSAPPDDLGRADLGAYRALMVLCAVAAPAFGALDRALGLAYDDPLAARLGLSAAALALLGLTYVSAGVRRNVQPITLLLAVGVGVVVSWAAGQNGLDGSGAVGVLLTAVVGGLSVTLLATSRREMPLSLAAVAVSLVLPLALMARPEGGFAFPLGLLGAAVAFVLGALYVAGDARLVAFEALWDRNRALAASERDRAGAVGAADLAEHTRRAFMAGVSRQLRTPAQDVAGAADDLADAALTPEHAEAVRVIQAGAEMLMARIDDARDLSLLESGAFEVAATPFDPAALVADVAEVARIQAERQGLALSAEVADGTPVAVVGDPARVRQVLFNLLANALEATPQGAVSLRLAPSGTDGDVRLEMAVQDGGFGLGPEAAAGLFEPGGDGEAGGPAGLGLEVSRRLAEAMGGSLRVESAPGVGSTWTAEVAVAPATDAETAEVAARRALRAPDLTAEPPPAPAPLDPAPPAPSPPLAAPEPPVAPEAVAAVGADRRVLVVEDNLVNQRVVGRLLDTLGYPHRATAVNGAEGLAALHRAAREGAPFDLVIMDVMMPVMDGHEAMRRLRAELPADAQPYVVTLTANAMDGDREAAFAAGADHYLTKPVRRDVLAEALAQAPSRVVA